MTQRRRAWIAFVGTLAALGVACSALPGGSGSACGPAEADPAATILFSDDFSDTGSGWDRVDVEEGVTDYADGVYRIHVKQPQHDYWANPGRTFNDVRVDVCAEKAGGPDDNDFGLICRYQDTGNFYAFLISSDGYYGIMRVLNGDSQMIGADGMEASDAIRQGGTTNRIRGDCVGNRLTLYVNDQLVHSVTDSSFASGDVGLIAGTYDESGTEIHFDNLFVYRP